MLENAGEALNEGITFSQKIKSEEQKKLQAAFDKLSSNLREDDTEIVAPETLDMLSHPALPAHVLKRSMPKSIVEFDNFIIAAKKLIQFLIAFMDGVEKPSAASTVHALVQNLNPTQNDLGLGQIRNKETSEILEEEIPDERPEPLQPAQPSISLATSFTQSFAQSLPSTGAEKTKEDRLAEIRRSIEEGLTRAQTPSDHADTNFGNRIVLAPGGGTTTTATATAAASQAPQPRNRDKESKTRGGVELMDDLKTERYSPSQVLTKIKEVCDIDPQTLHFMGVRFSKFLIKNKVEEFGIFIPLIKVLDFGAMLATYDEGFYVFVEPTMSGLMLQLYCVDSTLAFKMAQSHFNRIIITSGTLSPLNIYPLLLGFEPVSMVDFTMSLARKCLLPIILNRNGANVPLTSSFKFRSDPRIPKSYGELLLETCSLVPDGVVVFFPSYVYLRFIISEWNASDIMGRVLEHKLVFIEGERSDETNLALLNYRAAIDSGRGAVFLAVARGRISEGIDFSDHYGRCVLLFGLPVRNTQSMLVQSRAHYVYQKFGMEEGEFLLFDAMRAASQCIGRLLRSKQDYGIVILADRRFSRPKAKLNLPHWIRQFITNEKKDMSLDESMEKIKLFLLQMAQPFKFDPSKLIDTGSIQTL